MPDRPTRDDVLAEPPGPRLDAWVAEWVMGWEDVRVTAAFGATHVLWGNPPGQPGSVPVPAYSTDIAAAWEAADRYHRFSVDHDKDHKPNSWGVHLGRGVGDARSVYVAAPTAPLALCKAALLRALDCGPA